MDPPSSPLLDPTSEVDGALGDDYRGLNESPEPYPTHPLPSGRKKSTRKQNRIIVSHLRDNGNVEPLFKTTKFSSHTSNIDITRNVQSQFVIHPTQDILRYRMQPGGANLPEAVRRISCRRNLSSRFPIGIPGFDLMFQRNFPHIDAIGCTPPRIAICSSRVGK
jgi:hypothetical protein